MLCTQAAGRKGIRVKKVLFEGKASLLPCPRYRKNEREKNPVSGKYSKTRYYIEKTLELKFRFEAFAEAPRSRRSQARVQVRVSSRIEALAI